MNRYNVNVLADAKEEYSKQLVNVLYPEIYIGVKSIYDTAHLHCKETNDKNILKKFQFLLSNIPKWNQDKIDNEYNNIYATITPHHLVLDRNDIFYRGIHPHLYCLPILKKREDKMCLIKAAISGNSKFFLGTDNAPHLEKDKISSCGCAGIFNSPVAIEIITELFDKNNSLYNLEKFMSTNGCDFYKIPYNKEYICLKKEDWIVPNRYGNLIPLYNGKKIKWKIKDC